LNGADEWPEQARSVMGSDGAKPADVATAMSSTSASFERGTTIRVSAEQV